MRNLSDYPHARADCHEVANWLWDLKPGDKKYNSLYLVSKAAKMMQAAKWRFVDYDFKTGREVWASPDATEAK